MCPGQPAQTHGVKTHGVKTLGSGPALHRNPISGVLFRPAGWRCIGVFEPHFRPTRLPQQGACSRIHARWIGRRLFVAPWGSQTPYSTYHGLCLSALAPAVVDQVCVGCHGIAHAGSGSPATARHCFADQTGRKKCSCTISQDIACAGRSHAHQPQHSFHPGRCRRSD